ncbi:hypothetical protein [Methylosinus sp. LW4]|uniref:hypothetical protein n=1 Tax=Methylosinus sp. LW4 TaxID=136993 RepID=UPI0018DED350|nr:hypothetical protein [Methylosinus sp. LW4]
MPPDERIELRERIRQWLIRATEDGTSQGVGVSPLAAQNLEESVAVISERRPRARQIHRPSRIRQAGADLRSRLLERANGVGEIGRALDVIVPKIIRKGFGARDRRRYDALADLHETPDIGERERRRKGHCVGQPLRLYGEARENGDQCP